MKKKIWAGLAVGVMMLGITGEASARSIDGNVMQLQGVYRGRPLSGHTSTFTVDSTPGAIEILV